MADRKPSVDESYARLQRQVEEAFLRGFAFRQGGGARELPCRHEIDAEPDRRGKRWCICGAEAKNGECPTPEKTSESNPSAWLEGWDTADSTGRAKGEDYLKGVAPVPPPREHPKKLKYDDHPSLLEVEP